VRLPVEGRAGWSRGGAGPHHDLRQEQPVTAGGGTQAKATQKAS